MLALRLVLTEAPPTMVFDEVDAGVGGEAAEAVGRALAEVAERHQVLVVTHLAQVAACARQQLGVRKEVTDGRTVAHAAALEDDGRVVELARMLSGRPGSATARRHAEELLGPLGTGGARTARRAR
jgi:DNA repair protein RecN (Recombination protein N)